MPFSAGSRAQPKVGDSRLEEAWDDAALMDRRKHRPGAPVDRALSLLLLGLLCATAVLLWLQLLAVEPHWPLNWRLANGGVIELDDSSDPALHPLAGHRLQALVLPDGQTLAASTALLPQSTRWIVDDVERRSWQEIQQRLSLAAGQPSITLRLDGAADLTVASRPRGIVGLGPMGWLSCVLALTLMLAGAVVVLTGPG